MQIWAHLGISIIKKDILILAKGLTQGLNNITLTAKAEYSIFVTEQGRKLSLSLHYNESSS